jgi:hypothetical protein
VGKSLSHSTTNHNTFALTSDHRSRFSRRYTRAYRLPTIINDLIPSLRTVERSHNTFPEQREEHIYKMSLTNCRFYEEKYPEVESFVMVNVKQIAEMGAYVKLLEYGACRKRGSLWERG